MNRRDSVAALVALFAAGEPLIALAQRQEKLRRIGYLVMPPLTDKPSPERAALLEGLRALGYIEGRNLKIEYRSAEMEADFVPDLAAELINAGVELIFAADTSVVSAILKISSTIPIVFVSIADPVEMKFAHSLARPGKNVTGITLLGVSLAPKALELLRGLLPAAKRVAVLRGTGGTGVAGEWAALKSAAEKLGFALDFFSVRNAAELSHQLQRIAVAKPDALFVTTDQRTIAARRIIANFALAQRLPSVMGFSGYTLAGGLFSLATDFAEQFGRAATYVDKILKGAKPGELAIEQPTTFELVVNLKTARTLGITVPQLLLIRANRVIE